MAQSIKTSKFGTLDTSGRIPIFLSGEGEELKESFGLGFTINGTEYVFLPEDRVTKGTASGNKGAVMVGFLNPTVLDTFKNNSEYVDLSNTQFGTFDAGQFISDKLGGSTKGFIAPKTVYQPIFDAGLVKYDTSLTGPIKGIGNYQGQSVFYGDNGYVEPTGKTTYRQATGQEIIGSTYSNGGGLLAGLGREILKAGPALPIALDIIGASFGLPGLGTAVAGGVTAGAIASGDEKTAANYAAQTIAGQLGIGSGVAGATGSTIAGQMAQATAGNILAGQNPEDAVTNAAKSTAVSQAASAVAQNQAEKYIENLPIPDYLNAGAAPTSEDVIAAFPETNPATIQGPPTEIDTTLSNIVYGAPTGTTEGINATLPTTIVTGTEPVDYTLQAVTGSTGVQAQPDTTATTNLVQSPAGLQTYTYDDGSTITVNASGDIVGYTDATDTPYTGTVSTPSSPLTKSQVEGLIKLGLGVYGTSQVANVVRDAISSGDEQTQTGFPFTPSDISGWARPEYTQTWQAPLDLNSLFTTDNLLGGTQWAGLQGNQFANIPQVSMSDFISSIQNGKV